MKKWKTYTYRTAITFCGLLLIAIVVTAKNPEIFAQVKTLIKGAIPVIDTSYVHDGTINYQTADSSGNLSNPTSKSYRVVPVRDVIKIIDSSDWQATKTLLGGNCGALDSGTTATVTVVMLLEGDNPYRRIEFAMIRPDGFAGLWFAPFGRTNEPLTHLPSEYASLMKAIVFRARSVSGYAVNFKVEAKYTDGIMTQTKYFDANSAWQNFEMPLTNGFAKLKEVVIVIESRFQPMAAGSNPAGSLDLDDIGFSYDRQVAFPPQTEEKLLEFTKRSALNYFIWNYREYIAGVSGFVPERASFNDMISVSGLGFALAAYVMAELDQVMTPEETRNKVLGILNWLEPISAQSGNGGWNGFYYHFLKPDGTRSGTSEVGTIDMAILNAGLRVVKQYYTDDVEIQSLANIILEKPDWTTIINADGRISMGFSGAGAKLGSSWGTAFTEEADLVNLEAVASGQIDPMIFDKLTYVIQDGYWPSYFGAAFTYNWLQLWTGPIEPYATNSTLAYLRDSQFAQTVYGQPLMGFSACETFSGFDAEDFLTWDTYMGELGSDNFLSTGTVYHHSLCPYAAAQALPFARAEALAALNEFMDQGFVHPMAGFADSVRFGDLPGGINAPVPNWIQVAINEAAIWMSVEQLNAEGGRIGRLYRSDPEISAALSALLSTFE